MLQVKPKLPVYGELKEGSIALTFYSRHDNQRSFDKENAITVNLHAHQFGEILAQNCESPSFEISASSDIPQSPVKIKCSPDEEGKIVIEASHHKPTAHSVILRTSRGDFKVLQKLIESILPELYHWSSKPSASAATTPKSASTVSRFFSY